MIPPGLGLVTGERHVPVDWLDFNGHMNEVRYLQSFSEATDRLLEMIGCDAGYIAAGHSFFTAETHLRHLGEVGADAPLRITTLCLNAGGAKLHLFHQMFSAGRPLATGEHFLLHVSLASRTSAPPPPDMARKMAALVQDHAALPRPGGIGRAVGQR